MRNDDARATLTDGRLGISGALSVSNVAALWAEVCRLRYNVLDLTGLTSADSAALAMLSKLQDNQASAEVHGLPAHLDALRQAYRLDPHLRFTA
ncbi:STAS domain-containing protein [Lysobacter soyae]|uniref:STAS domain-containing protein n=1 Tax=Lysobacter soyae TaxID=2764185 RepID=A0ABX8WQL0_9GAMM|nr:STAS domain-containing protein [Lysobacter sp. CJ11]QYR53120.1 STAS domain-containing protein [Lysobacter sp. CJ11]